MKTIISLAVVLAIATGAYAAPVVSSGSAEFELINTVNIGGQDYNVWRMFITIDDSNVDWTNSRLDLELTEGKMYNDTLGTNTPPNPSFYMMPAFADLEWDTFVAAPGDYPGFPGKVGATPSVAGDTVMTDTVIGASWFDTATDTGNGRYCLAQITLSTDAQGEGTLSGRNYDIPTQGVGVPFGPLSIRDGMIVPEPSTLGLLVLGGLGAFFRRRR